MVCNRTLHFKSRLKKTADESRKIGPEEADNVCVCVCEQRVLSAHAACSVWKLFLHGLPKLGRPPLLETN